MWPRGQLLRRDRVEHLLDPGSPSLDIGQLAATDMNGDEVPGATQCSAFALTVPLRQIECSATSRTLFRHMQSGHWRNAVVGCGAGQRRAAGVLQVQFERGALHRRRITPSALPGPPTVFGSHGLMHAPGFGVVGGAGEPVMHSGPLEEIGSAVRLGHGQAPNRCATPGRRHRGNDAAYACWTRIQWHLSRAVGAPSGNPL